MYRFIGFERSSHLPWDIRSGRQIEEADGVTTGEVMTGGSLILSVIPSAKGRNSGKPTAGAECIAISPRFADFI